MIKDQEIGRAIREKKVDGVVVWGNRELINPSKEELDKMTRDVIKSIEQESFKVSREQNYHLSGE